MRIHISLNVSSLKDSIGFYTALFGQGASKTRDDYANFRLDEPPIHLALQKSGPIGRAGVSHVGVELPDAEVLGLWRARLEESGATFEVEDKAACCYARADKLWLSDPDGYRWEVWVRTGDYGAIGETRVEFLQASDSEAACCSSTESIGTESTECCPGPAHAN